jgi:Ca2+-binding EF-hand superfamily protein
MDKIKAEEILNEDEIRAAKDAFDAYDKMGYGTLEVEELQKVLEGSCGWGL